MLEVSTQMSKGIMFIRLEGELNKKTFPIFSQELNYLLYKQGIQHYVLNLTEVKQIDKSALEYLQNKLIEIFLSCGKVALCGLNEALKERMMKQKDQLFYVTTEKEVFQYLSI